jgi:hypothetical protein
MASGLVAGDYLRIGAGVTTPVNPQGSLRDWKSGTGASVIWENWQNGGSGVGRVGFGLGVAYSLLPLKQDQFLADFTPPLTGGKATSATASKAGILEVTSSIRIRIPAPLVMPTINVGIGFINWAPGKISYTSTTAPGTSTVKQQHRSGAEFSIGGSLDRQIYDRFAAYAEAAYVYGYTAYGRGFTTPGSVCGSAGCDPLKNTTVGWIRGGLRIRVKN